jgi:hypothetical protein
MGQKNEGALGCFRTEDGTYIYVRVDNYDMEQENSWTDNKRNTVIEMHEAIDYLLDKLLLEEIPEETVPTIETVTYDDIVISTPYADMFFPGEWEDNIRIEQIKHDDSTYTVECYGLPGNAADVHLFDVVFGKTDENVIGLLTAKNGMEVTVGIVLYPVESIDSNNKNMQIIQEGVNYLMEKLQLRDYEAESEESDRESAAEEQNEDDFIVQTPYAVLKYPMKWKEKISVEVIDADVYSVQFFGTVNQTKKHLFTVILGNIEQGSIGKIHGFAGEEINVSIEISEIDVSSEMSDEMQNELYAMQDDMNYLISQLPFV